MDELLIKLNEYPFCSFCFSPFLKWLAERPNALSEENALITVLLNKDDERLKNLEHLLCRSRDILGISDPRFRDIFGFSHDLLTKDPEKVHDILAEPTLVVNLSDYGFTRIQKLPKFIKHSGSKLPVADFIAQHSGKKYAIELKTIRMENNPKPVTGKIMGSSEPEWWIKMFKSNIETKIKDKDNKAVTQLSNTKKILPVTTQCLLCMIGALAQQLL